LTAVCRQRTLPGEEGFAMKGDEDGDRDRYLVGSGLSCYECVNLIFMVCGCMAVSFFLSVAFVSVCVHVHFVHLFPLLSLPIAFPLKRVES